MRTLLDEVVESGQLARIRAAVTVVIHSDAAVSMLSTATVCSDDRSGRFVQNEIIAEPAFGNSRLNRS